MYTMALSLSTTSNTRNWNICIYTRTQEKMKTFTYHYLGGGLHAAVWLNRAYSPGVHIAVLNHGSLSEKQVNTHSLTHTDTPTQTLTHTHGHQHTQIHQHFSLSNKLILWFWVFRFDVWYKSLVITYIEVQQCKLYNINTSRFIRNIM